MSKEKDVQDFSENGGLIEERNHFDLIGNNKFKGNKINLKEECSIQSFKYEERTTDKEDLLG